MNVPGKMSPFKKIMVIDDTSIDRYIADKLIIKTGFADQVISIESAMEALTYLEQHANQQYDLPQIIFLDIRMPEMDGFGFLASYELLPDGVKENCLVMMLSSSLNPEDLERAKDNKYVCCFLSKPLDREKLNTVITEYNLSKTVL